MIALIIVGVIIVIAIIIVAWAISARNSFVRLMNQVAESWHQIDVELKRRHDLIPNLVQTVQGYAQHESGVFSAVSQARAGAISASGQHDQAQAENVLTQTLGKLFAVAEAYPTLKADASFRELQQQLTETEDRIAAGRRYYNANVRQLNTRIDTFPASLLANSAHAVKAEYFEVDAADTGTPQVQFTQAPPTQFGAPENQQAEGQQGYPTQQQ